MLDFTELSDNGQDLELLVRELLFVMGYRVNWSGIGPDGGRDLICHELRDSIFATDTKKWLIQCKHFAHSRRAVSVRDLDDIVDSCNQHDATGYVLICSTYPSSAVIARLAGITRNKANSVIATYWDAVKLEQMLATPKLWPLAQRFFPVSSDAAGLKLYGTDSPNHWVANCRGYYFHISNRIGSTVEMRIPSILARIEEIETIILPTDHFVRIRAIYYDDKNAVYTWYLDYMKPNNEEEVIDIGDRLGNEMVWEDGQVYIFDIMERQYNSFSDHYDKDHYDYYVPYIHDFLYGGQRGR